MREKGDAEVYCNDKIPRGFHSALEARALLKRVDVGRISGNSLEKLARVLTPRFRVQW